MSNSTLFVKFVNEDLRMLREIIRVNFMEQSGIRLGEYQHWKGNRYEVIGVATHTETQEEFVVYRALYGEYGLWVRPLALFKEEVKVGDTTVPRFKYIGD